MLDKIKQIFYNEILLFRKARNSRFLFLPKTNLKFLVNLYILEYFRKKEKADKLLLSFILQDLVNRKVLTKNTVEKTEYKLGEFTYFDIHLKTFDNSVYSRGTSTNEMGAFAKALGEVFERFTIKHYAEFKDIKKISLWDEKLKGEILKYSEYPQATYKQLEKFENFRINEEDLFNCIKSKDIKTDEEKYITLQAISLNNQFLQDKKLIIYSTTNGAGAGYSLEQARNGALLEITHRHFFLNSWFQRESPNKIIFNHNDKELQNTNLYKKYQVFLKRDFTIHFVNLSEKAKSPTVICILEKLGGQYCGASSAFDLYSACERALDEAVSIYMWVCSRNLKGNKIYNKDILDSLESGFVDERATSGLKVNAFANSYFINNFDPFFTKGKEVAFDFRQLSERKEFKVEDILPGPVFEYLFKTKLLNDYNFHVAKYFAPHTQYFSLDEIYTKPNIMNGPEIVFDKINPFP